MDQGEEEESIIFDSSDGYFDAKDPIISKKIICGPIVSMKRTGRPIVSMIAICRPRDGPVETGWFTSWTELIKRYKLVK